jgi:peptide chain release factor 1
MSKIYLKYATKLEFSSEVLLSELGTFILKISGKEVYKHFQHESGKHVIQRVPPTEHKGRRHTSLITVNIVPLLNGTTKIKDSELEITTQKGHGPGGQHQNKTESAVRVKHIPTGIQVFINGRDQYRNKQEALIIIAEKVKQLRESTVDAAVAELRKEQVESQGRGNKIRTYNFIDSRIIDHRFNIKSNDIKSFLKGNLEIFYK